MILLHLDCVTLYFNKLFCSAQKLFKDNSYLSFPCSRWFAHAIVIVYFIRLFTHTIVVVVEKKRKDKRRPALDVYSQP